VHLVERTELDLKAEGDESEIGLNGQIRPAIAEAVIAIDMRDADGESYVRHVRTNADGIFEDRFSPKSEVRTVQASFAGDETHRSAESEVIPIANGNPRKS
jgi:hypothetical protein